ncbi:MAG: Hsp33 family molecular chaperone HslO [Eubacteriales bacterium]|nr:Hsp33 family molecular chaperone HslO [Eubacteriales bacterium]MDD3882518.1 Hsp33 family molecular chaperone HslO [Eubacteriales bacterium]MDD4512818.1 Hsp33 family molecular chaperone HslO [Eubacteriales bacterium]
MPENTDRILRAELSGSMVRVMLIDNTNMAAEAMSIHEMSHVAAAASGRIMAATSMISAMLKESGSSVTVTFSGNGPIGKIQCVGAEGYCRIAMDNPAAELPLRSNGKLPVSDAVGKTGKLSVVKDIGLKTPYIGQCELVSGEIAEDFAMYFTVSEQQPSLVALGVLVAENCVIKSGGIIVQPLPGCPDGVIEQLELRSQLFSQISRELAEYSLEELLENSFRGLEPKVLGTQPVGYRCGCTRERMERALVSLGRKELDEMIAERKDIDMACHFCRRLCHFTPSELQKLREYAVKKEDSESKG